MTVNVDNIPATITSVDMDLGNDSAKVWGQPGDVTGIIRGTYLAGGKVSIAEKTDLGISGDPETIDESSTDAALHFKMTLSKAIPSGKTLTFTVTKQDKTGKSVQSLPYVLAVQYNGPVAPEDPFQIKVGDSSLDMANPILNMTGKDLDKLASVSLVATDGSVVGGTLPASVAAGAASISVSFPKDKLKPGMTYFVRYQATGSAKPVDLNKITVKPSGTAS